MTDLATQVLILRLKSNKLFLAHDKFFFDLQLLFTLVQKLQFIWISCHLSLERWCISWFIITGTAAKWWLLSVIIAILRHHLWFSGIIWASIGHWSILWFTGIHLQIITTSRNFVNYLFHCICWVLFDSTQSINCILLLLSCCNFSQNLDQSIRYLLTALFDHPCLILLFKSHQLILLFLIIN